MAMEEQPRARRVGILGYGELGQFLVSQLLSRGPSVGLSLAFVWARRWEALEALPPALRLRDLSELPSTGVDLVVEVAHPCVTQEHGEDILAHADLMVTPRGHGGPGPNGPNVPNVLKVTMTKAPGSFRAEGDNDQVPPRASFVVWGWLSPGWRAGRARTREACGGSPGACPSSPTTSTPWRRRGGLR
ncbi:putative L-aspartate dehydrogenase [Camarhynchus parvulus]|uniref:putative L-aspartate dehydrogenase n=1 Tax=Geospiza parvula TaxID=87175 RepID=UPI0012380C44|nr:putative L-aspartate dehydrogenase [Camarhynchus parvulus]